MGGTETAASLARRHPRPEEEQIVVEPRWPIVLSVSVIIVVTVVLRIAEPVHELSGLAVWLLSGIELVMLVALIAADSVHVTSTTRWFRWVAITLTMTLAAATLLDTFALIVNLVGGSKVTASAGPLLASGTVVWLGNCLVFGLAYWQLDSGGPLARYRGDYEFADFAFTQRINPDLAPPGWRPRYVDYLALGFTTSTAFSPTDVMPMSPWAKLSMALQSLISLILLGLVIARAVNVLP